MSTLVLLLMLADPRILPPGTPEQRYDYYSYAPADGALRTHDEFSIDVARRVYWTGHSGVGIKLCPADESFFCFFGPPMSFAVPKRALSKDASWELNGSTFRVLGEERLRILGSDKQAWWIASVERDGRAVRFYFSEADGLLGVALPIKGTDQWQAFYVTGACGFPKVPSMQAESVRCAPAP
jgi:hypothetical protein